VSVMRENFILSLTRGKNKAGICQKNAIRWPEWEGTVTVCDTPVPKLFPFPLQQFSRSPNRFTVQR
jgi:hypothetical protein